MKPSKEESKTTAKKPQSPIVETISGRGLPVRGDNIDTDRILPARFLRCVTFDGIEAHVFEDDRSSASSQHPFDQPRFQGAAVLVVNQNFGSGSSREHAPQGLIRWGIRGLVGESFAEIFSGNCVAIGAPCVTLAASDVKSLQAATEKDPEAEITLDLKERRVLFKPSSEMTGSPSTYAAGIPESVRESFLTGTWDVMGILLESREAVQAVARRLPYVRGFAGGRK